MKADTSSFPSTRASKYRWQPAHDPVAVAGGRNRMAGRAFIEVPKGIQTSSVKRGEFDVAVRGVNGVANGRDVAQLEPDAQHVESKVYYPASVSAAWL